MKKLMTLALVLSLGLAGLSAQTVMLDGYAPGSFTMDYQAALDAARQSDRVLFLNFTGSDWCSWCQLMQATVFSKPQWTDFARERLVLVTLDFPRNQDIVPERYRQRNAQLQGRFNVEGYPTFVVLDADGATELGRLSAGRGKSPQSFSAELRPLLRRSLASLQAFGDRLPEAARAAYGAAVQLLVATRAELAQNRTPLRQLAVDVATEAALGLQEDYLVTLMTADEQASYRSLKPELAAARQNEEAWLATQPANTEANQAKFRGFQERIAGLEAELQELLAKYE